MASKKSSFKIGVSGLAFKSKLLAPDKSDLVWNLTSDFVSTKLLLYLPYNARAETPMCIMHRAGCLHLVLLHILHNSKD